MTQPPGPSPYGIPPAPPRPQVWLDRDPLRTSWSAPRRAGRWRWLVLGVVFVVVAAAVGVGVAGGFGPRTDERVEVAPGTVVQTGLYQIEFSHAVAYRDVDPRTKKVRRWSIRVYGSGRTTGTTSGAPSQPWWAIGRSGTGIGEGATVYRIGGLAEIGADFQPGMPMTTLVIGATFPAQYVPDGSINVVVTRAELVNNSVSGSSSGLVYLPGRQHYFLTLPLTVVDE